MIYSIRINHHLCQAVQAPNPFGDLPAYGGHCGRRRLEASTGDLELEVFGWIEIHGHCRNCKLLLFRNTFRTDFESGNEKIGKRTGPAWHSQHSRLVITP